MRLHFRTLALAALVLAFVLTPSGPARAAGPFDGVYIVVTSNPGIGYSETSLAVLIQNGGNVAFVNLFGDGTWDFGVGTFLNATTIAGTLYQPNGSAYGTFQVAVAGGASFAGQATFGGYTFAVNGTRAF